MTQLRSLLTLTVCLAALSAFAVACGGDEGEGGGTAASSAAAGKGGTGGEDGSATGGSSTGGSSGGGTSGTGGNTTGGTAGAASGGAAGAAPGGASGAATGGTGGAATGGTGGAATGGTGGAATGGTGGAATGGTGGATGFVCGNNLIEGTEECDGTDLGGARCSTVGGGFSSGVLACSACSFDTSGCSTIAAPAAGDLVITEIMHDPSAFSDVDGEWFEIRNTGSVAVNLQGCVISGTGGATDTFTVTTQLVAPAGGHVSFAVASATAGAPGFTADYEWTGGFGLGSSDGITIACNGTTIDMVLWNGGVTFPVATGQSLTLDPGALNANDNDSGSNWCTGLSEIGTTTDLGTPGATNDPCQTYPVNFCRLQFPTSITGAGAEATAVYGRVFVAGLTDLTGSNDPYPRLRAQVGFGPDGSNPVTSTLWTWIDAAPNAGYGSSSPAYESANDEYVGTLIAPTAGGSYDFAYRFSGDTGTTWAVCDSGAGTSDGYNSADAGQMAITPALTITSIMPGNIDVLTGGTGILVVQISAAAPAGGFPVAISSSTSSVSVPAALTIPQGTTSAGFRVRGGAVAGSSVITATNSASVATANVNVVSSALAPVAGELVLNEINIDPFGSTVADVQGDANCDGSRSDVLDEFLELVNASGHPLALGGVGVWDQTSYGDTLLPPQFVFPSFVLGPGEPALVFGGPAGGTSTTQPWCAGATASPFRIGDALAFGAALSLGNGGDTVRITATNNRASAVIAMATWGTTVAVDQSWTRSPDITGPYTPYLAAAGHLTDHSFSPGTLVTGFPFASASAP